MLDLEKVFEIYYEEVDNINKKYQDYFNKNIKSKKNDIEFEIGLSYGCYPKEMIVEIPLLVDEKNSLEFLESVEKVGGNIEDISMEMWSVLHEIGHLQTRQDIFISPLLRKICKILKQPLLNKVYFNIPEEKKATKWAVNYVNNNKNDLLLFQENIMQDYYNLFKKIGLQEEE